MPFAHNGETQIFWRDNGSGEPLLLIMGLGYTSDMWCHMEPGLAAHFRVILFDNRGVGKSDTVPGPHLIPTMAADAAAVLDAAEVETAHVFGVSMGGYIAQEFALNHPQRVRSLIVGCASCGGEYAVPAKQEVWDAASARLKMLPNASHMFTTDQPEEAIASILEFLSCRQQ